MTLSSDHTDIVSVIDSSTIKALKVGSATITAMVTEEDVYKRQDLRRAASPIVFPVEDGVYNLTAEALVTTPEDAGSFALYTNLSLIHISFCNSILSLQDLHKKCNTVGAKKAPEEIVLVSSGAALLHSEMESACLLYTSLVDARKAETVAGAVEPGDIFPRAEELHAAVRAAVGLEALKDLGAVVQDAGRRGHGDGAEGHDARVVPAVLVGIVHVPGGQRPALRHRGL